VKITAIDTIQLDEYPHLIFVQISTDEGFTGVSDTYYATDAIASFVHQTASPVLLGEDPFQVERHWDKLYTHHMVRGAGIGMEMRALSAIDTAMWDIRGQALGVPIYQLLGGLAQESVRTYNTCSGPNYGLRGFNREGEGDFRYDDLWAQFNAPARLAEDLLSEGITAMKIWPFDRFALSGGGRHITVDELERGLEPFRKIREAVGGQIDIMLEGHGYWDRGNRTTKGIYNVTRHRQRDANDEIPVSTSHGTAGCRHHHD
jgi:L-alanine-DL-glutamate epimerase-like enolase superfamily enzyme